MFEVVYDIVGDFGDPNQTEVGTLSAPLSTGGTITSLAVQELALSVATNVEITLISGPFQQTFQTSLSARVHATAIPVAPIVPNFAYPAGTPVQLAYVPGWANLLDPVQCPAEFLPFLAQFVGADVPATLDAPTARAKIVGESAQHRGTLSAVTSAVKRNLTGTQTTSVIERVDAGGNTNAYYFTIVVHPSEAPDPQAIIDAVNAVKPGGVLFTLVLSDAFLWNQAIHTWNADTMTWNATANQQP